MLSDEDKARIRLEEFYRHEIRASLSPPAQSGGRGSRVLGFFQSNLGLWLLSAVFITGIGSAWKAYDSARIAERTREERVSRLDLEAAYRLSLLQVDLHGLADHTRGDTLLRSGVAPTTVDSLLLGLRQPLTGGRTSLYPEYGSYSTLAVVSELRRHVPGAGRDELDQVIAHITGLPVLLDVEEVSTGNPSAVAALVLRELRLSRWTDNEFYFLDCPPTGPFC